MINILYNNQKNCLLREGKTETEWTNVTFPLNYHKNHLVFVVNKTSKILINVAGQLRKLLLN